MARTLVQRKIYQVEWNGSNGNELAQLLTDIDTEDGVYTVAEEIPGDHLTMNVVNGPLVGTRTIWAHMPIAVVDLSRGVVDFVNAAQSLARFIPTTQVPGPTPPTPTLSVGVGSATVGALLLGGSTTVSITWDSPMPNTGYAVKWRAVSGVNVLSMLVLNGTVTKTTAGCTIPVRANGLASAAGLILAEAYLLT